MKTKTLYTNWTDVIVAEGTNWQSLIVSGYERHVESYFGLPSSFGGACLLIQKLENQFVGKHAYVTEKHQDGDDSLSLPSMTTMTNNGEVEDGQFYYTRTLKIISFSNEEDATLFKLSLEKIEECVP